MATSQITRRGFMGHVGGAYTAMAMGAGATVTVADPMLDLIERYRAQMRVFNATPDMGDDEMDALADVTYGPVFDELAYAPPPITTERGAIEAIRATIEEHGFKTPLDESLTRAALTYFDSRSA